MVSVMRFYFAALMSCALSFFCPLAPALAESHDRIVVASKIDIEGALLGSIILLILEQAKVPVESRLRLGPTRVVRIALLAGDIDVYPEYTGNGALFFDKSDEHVWGSPDDAYKLVKHLDRERNNLVWLDPSPANNVWAIAVRSDLAGRERLATMEDFARFANSGGHLRLAASSEFVESPAALPAFQRTYGFELAPEQIQRKPGGDSSATMHAAAENEKGVNCAMVYGTDGTVQMSGLVLMADPKGAQIAYQPSAVMRATVLEKFPEIGPRISKAFRSLTLAWLRKMNVEVAKEGRTPRDVARDYLIAQRVLH